MPIYLLSFIHEFALTISY